MTTNQLIKFTEAESTNLSLDIPDDMPFDEWNELGQKLASAERVLNWWIGDWWIAGNHRYGDRAAIAAQGVLGKSLGTLKNLGSTARKFEPSRRRDLLSFSHHVEVASLPPGQADQLLVRAEQEKLSVVDLRRAVFSIKLDEELMVFDPDHDQKSLVELARAWNRSSLDVRKEFTDMIEEADGGIIDP